MLLMLTHLFGCSRGSIWPVQKCWKRSCVFSTDLLLQVSAVEGTSVKREEVEEGQRFSHLNLNLQPLDGRPYWQLFIRKIQIRLESMVHCRHIRVRSITVSTWTVNFFRSSFYVTPCPEPA